MTPDRPKDITGRSGRPELKPASHLPLAIPGRRPRVYVGRNGRIRAEPNTQSQEPNLTGRYEEFNATFALLLNQAGDRLEAWFTPFLQPDETAERKSIRLGGTRQTDGSFLLRPYFDSDAEFRVCREGTTTTLQATGGPVERLLLIDARATLSSRSLPEGIDVHTPPWCAEWAPLPAAAIKRIAGRVDRLAPLVKRVFAEPPIDEEGVVSSNGEYSGQLTDEFVVAAGELFRELGVLGRCEDVAPNDRLLAKWFVQRYLKETEVEVEREFVIRKNPAKGAGDIPLPREIDKIARASQYSKEVRPAKRSLHWWIETVYEWLLAFPNTKLPGRMQDSLRGTIREYVGWRYSYEVTLEFSGIGGKIVVNGGIWNVTVAVRQLAPTSWPQPAVLYGEAYSLGVGVEVGVLAAFKTTAQGLAPVPWAPGDFIGPMSLSDASIWKCVPPDCKAVGATFCTFFGNGINPPLEIDFSGGADVLGGGGGGSVTNFTGTLTAAANEYSGQLDASDASPPYQLVSEAKGTRHFDFGVALLREEGRAALQQFCATYLAVLRNPSSSLMIQGHADRPDTPERNKELSKLRAENVLQAMKDILGVNLRAEIIQVQGQGETLATAFGDREGKRNPAFRRVDVFVCGTRALTLRVQ